jgi:hypothetical protein
MTDSEIPYRYERVQVTQPMFNGWNLDRVAEKAWGPCPKCGHTTTSDVITDAVAMGFSDEAPTSMDRVFACGCKNPHPFGAHATREDCGRWWLVTIQPEGTEPAIVAAADDTNLAAATALLDAAPGEEEAIRKAAQGWIAGVTALLGLFGLAGIVTGKDALSGLDTLAKALIAIALIAALVLSCIALLRTYKASYGWPGVVDVSDNRKLGEWYSKRQSSVKQASDNLRTGVYFAIAALGALVLTVGIFWFSPVSPKTPLVNVTSADDSIVCGELLSSTSPGNLRVRRGNGSVSEITASQAKIKNVSSCTVSTR